ncbi:MAG: hypothetical protein ACE5OS_08630 [Anaerolineae bacterium]
MERRLRTYLRRWGLRLRLAESLTWGLWGGAVGLGLGLALALAARLWPLLRLAWLAGLAGLLALVGVALGLAVAWLLPLSLYKRARIFDRRFGLAERLTTAVEIGTRQLRVVPAMARAQLADTLEAAGRVDPRVMLPLRASRHALLAFGVLAAALVLSLWLPNPQEGVLLQRAAVRTAIEEQIRDLEAAREEVAEAEGLTEAEREMLLQALEEAIAALDSSTSSGPSEGRATPEEAVAALSEAEQALAELQDPGAATVQRGLERAAEEMADSELTRDIAEALAGGNYEEAAQALAACSGTKGEQLTREEELELARELTQAAEALAESDLDGSTELAEVLAEQLTQAAEAIERGDIAEAREAIREAAQRMGETGERVQRQEAVESVLAELQEGREQIAQAGGAGQPLGQGGVAGQMTQQGEQQGGQQAGGGRQTQPAHSEDAGSGAPYDEVYVPYRFDEEGAGVNVGREGGEGVPTGGVPLPAPESGRASVPYREVYADYADQAGAALEGSYIPLGLKQYVRDYFSSLEP